MNRYKTAEEPKVSPTLPDWCVLLSTDSDEDWIFQVILKIRFLFYFPRLFLERDRAKDFKIPSDLAM